MAKPRRLQIHPVELLLSQRFIDGVMCFQLLIPCP